MSIKTQPYKTPQKPSHPSHNILTFDIHLFMMRSSWLLFVLAFCTTGYSQGTQQMLGSLDLLGSSYKCENGKSTCFENHTEKLIEYQVRSRLLNVPIVQHSRVVTVPALVPTASSSIEPYLRSLRAALSLGPILAMQTGMDVFSARKITKIR
jgi:hypothetical protein